jgi:hypothetical protein
MNTWEQLANDLEISGGGDFVNPPKTGDDPMVLQYQSAESVPCEPHEMKPSNYDKTKYAFCRPNGKTSMYTFLSPVDGSIKVMRTPNAALVIACKDADIKPGEIFKLWRTGSDKDTRFHIERLTPEQVAAWVVENKAATAEADAMEGPKQSALPISEPEPAPLAKNAYKEPEVNPEDIPF